MPGCTAGGQTNHADTSWLGCCLGQLAKLACFACNVPIVSSIPQLSNEVARVCVGCKKTCEHIHSAEHRPTYSLHSTTISGMQHSTKAAVLTFFQPLTSCFMRCFSSSDRQDGCTSSFWGGETALARFGTPMLLQRGPTGQEKFITMTERSPNGQPEPQVHHRSPGKG